MTLYQKVAGKNEEMKIKKRGDMEGRSTNTRI
jgi:hypothetical protein